MIKEFFKKYWKEKKIKKWDYLYKKEENDKNIYFIESWKILLTINNQDIAIVWAGEISGEKSFLNKTWKPIDAKAISDVKAFFITPESFNNFPETEKTIFLKQLTLFISDRVYLLNDIISNISYINHYITKEKTELSLEYIKNLFANIFELENAYIYKIIEWAILPIFESKINLSYNDKLGIPENEISLQENKVLVKIDNFFLNLEFLNLKKSKYVVENTLIHSTNNLKYLCEKLENIKNQQLTEFLE